jgi:hypothetical protein
MAHELDFLESYDRNSIAAELRRIAAHLGKTSLNAADIDRHGRVCSESVRNKFGNLNNALLAAGLKRTRRFTSAELLTFLVDLWTRTSNDHGRSPVIADLERYGFPVHLSTLAYHFGSWSAALVAASRFSKSGAVPVRPRGTRKPRRSIAMSVRFRVFQRDLFQCCICHVAGVRLEVDHIIPLSRGGEHTLDNMQTLCVPCNRGKSDRLQ